MIHTDLTGTETESERACENIAYLENPAAWYELITNYDFVPLSLVLTEICPYYEIYRVARES